MIDRQQLAEALARLDPRDREVLYLSLRRRVPDDDLAQIFEVDAAEVARMRAAAVERLSDAMGVQRGADLGHMLKELLDPDIWQVKPMAAAQAPGEEQIEPAADARAPGEGQIEPAADARAPGEGHRPVGASTADAGAERRAPSTSAEAGPADSAAAASDLSAEPRAVGPASAGGDAVTPSSAERAPVLGILEPDPWGTEPAASRPSGARRLAVAVAVAVALLVPAGVVAALTSGQPGTTGSSPTDPSVRPFQPEPAEIGQPFPSDPAAAGQYPVARVERRVVLYREPGGKTGTRLDARTEFDSPRVLSVVEQREGWLGVLTPELENGEVGWIEESDVASVEVVPYAIHVDLSERELVVRHNDRPVRRLKIGVGRSSNPTPPGRYAVTDKLRPSDPDSPYGCCVLALNGHQVRLPEGWPGGDRLAIHATRDLSGLGEAVSLGCMRTDPEDARFMLETVPLGAPVFVRA